MMNPPYLEAFDSTSRRRRVYKLNTDETFKIGRDVDSDIVVTEKEFCRNHAKIDYCSDSRKWYFTVKGRRNFLVNDEACQSLEPLELKDGMKITLDTSGRHSYIVRLKTTVSPRKKETTKRERRPESSRTTYSSSEEEYVPERSSKKRRLSDSRRRTSSCARSSEMRRKYNKVKEENQRLEADLKDLQIKQRQHRREKNCIATLRRQLREKEECLNMIEARAKEVKEEAMDIMKQAEDKKSALRNEIREEVEAVHSVQRHEMQEEVYESVKQQVMLQFTDIMENELQCSICTDFFINPVTVQCSHTFCRHCIMQWKKKNNVCPVCRSNIKTITDSAALMNFMEQALMLFPEDVKQKRMETKAQIATEVAQESEPSTSARNDENSRSTFHDIINLMSDISTPRRDDDDDDNRSILSSISSVSTVEMRNVFSRSSSSELSSDTEEISTSEETDPYEVDDFIAAGRVNVDE